MPGAVTRQAPSPCLAPCTVLPTPAHTCPLWGLVGPPPTHPRPAPALPGLPWPSAQVEQLVATMQQHQGVLDIQLCGGALLLRILSQGGHPPLPAGPPPAHAVSLTGPAPRQQDEADLRLFLPGERGGPHPPVPSAGVDPGLPLSAGQHWPRTRPKRH